MQIEKLSLKDYGFSGYLAKSEEQSTHGVVVILGGESVVLPFLKAGKGHGEIICQRRFYCSFCISV